MAGSIRVVPEDLHVSATKVGTHAEELEVRHTAAHGRIEAAQVGTPAASAVALSAVVAKWQADTAALFGNLVGHGEAMRGAAVGYQHRDQSNAVEIDAVGEQAGTADVRL